jgi:putative chitobiose transport system permease protein
MAHPHSSTVRMNVSHRKMLETIFWYAVLGLIAAITAFPFIWVFSMSVKGPHDAIYSVPPQLIPSEPTFDNYVRVWNQLPISRFSSIA